MAKGVARNRMYRLGLELDKAKSEVLKEYGWEHTCSTPGSIWLWRRDFIREDDRLIKAHNILVAKVKEDGREYRGSRPQTHGIVLCDRETAIMITERYLEGFNYGE